MRCVSVLVREYPADLPALEHAACVAKATNARLLVIIVPLLSLWRTGYLFTTQGPTLGLMPTPSETLLDEAIDSLVAETLRQVSQDLPVTLRAIPRAHPSAVANIVAGAGSQLLIRGQPHTGSRWRRVLARHYRKAQHTPGCLGRWLPSEQLTASA